MKFSIIVSALAIACLRGQAVYAFETHTHAYVTYQAYGASLLGSSGIDI